MLRRFLIFAVIAVPLFSADWVEYRAGPFHIFSNAGDRAARQRLNQLEQLRHVLGALLGKDGMSRTGTAQELTALWPIHLVLFARQREYAPYALPKTFVDGGGATLCAWAADIGKGDGKGDASLPLDVTRGVTQILVEDNAGRMPEEIETALADLLSTMEVTGTRVRVGGPLDLAGPRQRTWAKLQMMATQPAYTGKLRIYLNNLQNASDEDTASRNAFDVPAAKLNADVDAYARTGKFEAAPVNGRALNPDRDFIEKTVDKAAMDALLAELLAGGKTFPPESPRGLLAKNTRPALELAIRANPRWAEPHVKMAELETTPAAKIAQWKLAASLAPRNAGYWQPLAELQSASALYADAEKTWTAAERAAANPADRARIHQAKLALEDQRAAALMVDRNHAREEEIRDLQRVKDAAAEEVRAAERRVNERLRVERGDAPEPVKPIPLSALSGDEKGAKVAGVLTRVDCLNGPLRLSIQRDDASVIRLLIRDPKKMTVALNSGDAVFVCGVAKPARKIEVQHNGKADAKTGTAGDITLINILISPLIKPLIKPALPGAVNLPQ